MVESAFAYRPCIGTSSTITTYQMEEISLGTVSSVANFP